VMYTRVRAPFTARSDLRLLVRPRMFFDRLVRGLGLGRYVPSGAALAATHVVRGRPRRTVRATLAAGLAEGISRHGAFRVEVKRAPLSARSELGRGARSVEVLAPGVDTDVDRMVGMFEVARLALDSLVRAGVASMETPKRPGRSD